VAIETAAIILIRMVVFPIFVAAIESAGIMLLLGRSR
jgi:hypothetical protein